MKPFTTLYVSSVRSLMKSLEVNHLGTSFGLYLHYECHLTLDKITEMTQLGRGRYDDVRNLYPTKVLLYNPNDKNDVVNVPRLAPPRYKLVAAVKSIEEKLGVKTAEDGRLAFKPVLSVFDELLLQDPGTHGMPRLEHFDGGVIEIPVVLSLDATGFGSQQFNTVGINNPYMSKSATNMRIIGLGNCDDGRSGSTRLLGPNLAVINELVHHKAPKQYYVGSRTYLLKLAPWFVFDVSALRHIEHIAASGWCGCSRELALRVVPRKPISIEDM